MCKFLFREIQDSGVCDEQARESLDTMKNAVCQQSPLEGHSGPQEQDVP